MLKNYVCLHVKDPLFLSDINKTWIFPTEFRKTFKNKMSRKSVQREPMCSMRTNGQTDSTKLIVAFRNFANAPKNSIPLSCATDWEKSQKGI